MPEPSRYAPPKSAASVVDSRGQLSAAIQRVYTGRRLLMIALAIIAFGLAALQALPYASALVFSEPEIYLAISISTFAALLAVGPIVGIVGAFRSAGALGYSSYVAFVLACAMVIPGVNIGIAGWLAISASRELKANGIKVGVFGLRHS